MTKEKVTPETSGDENSVQSLQDENARLGGDITDAANTIEDLATHPQPIDLGKIDPDLFAAAAYEVLEHNGRAMNNGELSKAIAIAIKDALQKK